MYTYCAYLAFFSSLVQIIFCHLIFNYYEGWQSYKCPDQCVVEQLSLFKCIANCSYSKGCIDVSINLNNKTCCKCPNARRLQIVPGHRFFKRVKGKVCVDDLATELPDFHFSATSLAEGNTASRGRLHTQQGNGLMGGWVPVHMNQFIQVLFYNDHVKEIHAVSTQGRSGDLLEWTTTYKVSYSTDCLIFEFVQDNDNNTMIFPGNVDQDTVVTNDLPEPLLARCVRIHPETHNNNPSLRLGIKECHILDY